jgi:hypothetical protein
MLIFLPYALNRVDGLHEIGSEGVEIRKESQFLMSEAYKIQHGFIRCLVCYLGSENIMSSLGIGV